MGTVSSSARQRSARADGKLRLHLNLPGKRSKVENWAIVELLKNYSNRSLEPDLYFWRDSRGNEIDLLLDFGQRLIPIEINSGETVAGDFFKGLEYWRRLSGFSEAPGA